jgi:Ca2+-dependent lipid-binding protein
MAFDSSFLSVTVLRANGLADGAVNPFVRLLLGNQLLFKTKAIKSCRNPVWTRKNAVRFVAPSSYAGSDERLTVEIWDKRPSLRVDRFLAVVYVPLASLPAMPPTDARAAEITLPCRPYGTVTLKLLHHSEAGSWLHQELRARKQQPEQAQNMDPKVVPQKELDPPRATTCTSSSTSAVDHCCLF